jgi:hypothetical protein
MAGRKLKQSAKQQLEHARLTGGSIGPKHAYVREVVHVGSERIEVRLPCPLFQSEIAAAIVKSAWMNVPRNNHRRVFAPIQSPMGARTSERWASEA